MKIPEKAPSITNLSAVIEKVITLTFSADFKQVINLANRDYIYWDKFKYIKIPEDVSHEVAWFALKLTRKSMMKTIPLPHPSGNLFNYWVPDYVQANLHFIDQNAGGQILVNDPIPKKEKEHYLMRSIVEEAIASSLIEGAATTRRKALEMFKTGRQPKSRAEQMVYNNYLTISKIKDLINQPLTPELLIELQGSMTKDTLENPSYEGRFRKETDDQIEVIDVDGQVLHTPPSAAEVLKLTEDLCNFGNREVEDEFMHPVVKGIILHFWLAYIHPFMDGNGRTSRAIFYWYLLKKKYWLVEYLSISRIILKAPMQYYKAFLYSEVDEGDMTYFLTFHLRAIKLAIRELNIYLEKKQRDSMDAIEYLGKFPNLNYRQRALLLNAINNPKDIYTFQTHMKSHSIVYQTARNDFFDLEEKGFLTRIRNGKKFVFIPAEKIKDLTK